jgi:hypothetical protein
MSEALATHLARWDLDKTYLRTEFDTLRDLVRTALERADQKRSHPGAAALIRELSSAGAEIHILSGSPEQLRRRLAAKLEIDGIRYASLTLKPNLQNLLRGRFRSLRGQLGYKLPALLRARVLADAKLTETLVGDDAEADAFVYRLYGDLIARRVDLGLMLEVMRLDRCHPEEIENAEIALGQVERADAVERILIHLDRQTPPSDFDPFGPMLAPFYNYFQAALVLHEDGRIGAEATLRVATDLVIAHRFDGDALVRSYLELARRGHLNGSGLEPLLTALERWPAQSRRSVGGTEQLFALSRRESELRKVFEERSPRAPVGPPDYLSMVGQHNRRRSK